VSAALANGTSAQALDFDDIAPSCVSHVGAVVIPALLGLQHRFSADAGMEGLLAGLMVIDRLAEAFTHEVYDRGIQPTHTMGALGATVALTRALGFDEAARLAALGLVATQMIGLRSHTGTRYKAVQAGVVSAAAVRSVLLAESGITAGDDALDVVLRMMGIGDEQLATLQRPGALRPVPLAAKYFPTCGAAHTAIEATLELRAGGFDPAATLVVSSPPRVMDALAFPDPRTPDEARFSMQYCVARAWAAGHVHPADFDEDALRDAAVRSVMRSVAVEIDDSLTPPPTWSGFPAVVRVDTNGDRRQARVDRPLGYPERPLSEQQWRDKFDLCAVPVVGDARAAELYARLSGPDALACAANEARA
jgi:2-methylcitrate dehydratase PrpD